MKERAAMQDLEGKVAVVTGAASGIGRALAEQLAGQGCKLVLADIERAPLDAVRRQLAEAGTEAVAVPTDVSNAEQVDALAAAARESFGAVHVLCNNAGVGGGGPIAELTTADWQWVLGVNLWGVIHGLRAFLPILQEQDQAHVVNTASVAGLVAPAFMGSYAASKFAVVAISEVLKQEMDLAGGKVGVSVLCPGWVNTGIGESERNRPADLPARVVEETAERAAMREMLAGLLAGGMAPAEVARRVVDAVRANRFYILTHDDMRAGVEARYKRILTGEPPVFEMV